MHLCIALCVRRRVRACLKHVRALRNVRHYIPCLISCYSAQAVGGWENNCGLRALQENLCKGGDPGFFAGVSSAWLLMRLIC